MATAKPKGLGRGLEALLGPKVSETASNAADLPSALALEQLVPGQYQPRTHMDEGALYELANSIQAQGIMQPILVRRLSRGEHAGKYEIIAGERRFRAARIAGLTQVPVLVRDVADEAATAMALIENIQREDLNPLEEAQGLQRLVQEFGHARAGGPGCGAQSLGGQQPAAAAAAGATSADHAYGRRPGHGPRACAAQSGQGRADQCGQPGGGTQAVGA